MVFSKVDYTKWFTLSHNNRTRGHRYKLNKPKSRLEIRRNFFSLRVINEWNKLPNDVVEATSINMFKNRYDRYKSGEV